MDPDSCCGARAGAGIKGQLSEGKRGGSGAEGTELWYREKGFVNNSFFNKDLI